eukprot:IDg2111t1
MRRNLSNDFRNAFCCSGIRRPPGPRGGGSLTVTGTTLERPASALPDRLSSWSTRRSSSVKNCRSYAGTG